MESWKGYEKKTFEVNGRESCVICPHEPAEGRPWIWRAEFLGAFDTVDMALLERGWHLAYHKVSDMYGCPEAVASMRDFQQRAVRDFQLKERTVLLGFSRGGLYAVNYAVAYPDKVAALYLDAPVLDIRSWPGGKGVGPGDSACWEQCKACYGLDEETAASFSGNPLDQTEKLAGAGIPVIVVAGLADEVVPYEENARLFVPHFRAAGGTVELIEKPGCGHHPHSLEDPAPVVDFLLRHT